MSLERDKLIVQAMARRMDRKPPVKRDKRSLRIIHDDGTTSTVEEL